MKSRIMYIVFSPQRARTPLRLYAYGDVISLFQDVTLSMIRRRTGRAFYVPILHAGTLTSLHRYSCTRVLITRYTKANPMSWGYVCMAATGDVRWLSVLVSPPPRYANGFRMLSSSFTYQNTTIQSVNYAGHTVTFLCLNLISQIIYLIFMQLKWN